MPVVCKTFTPTKSGNRELFDFSEEERFNEFRGEIKIAQKLIDLKKQGHFCEGIVDFYGLKNGRLVMEDLIGYDTFDEFFNKYPKLTREQFIEIETKLNEALDFLHSHGITHNDLHEKNVMLKINDDGISVKIIDFGKAVISETPSIFRDKENIKKDKGSIKDIMRKKIGKFQDFYSSGVH